MVEEARLVQAVSQQEIGEGNTARPAGNGIAGRPAAIKSEGAAGDVRLGVVVVRLYELAARRSRRASPRKTRRLLVRKAKASSTTMTRSGPSRRASRGSRDVIRGCLEAR